MNHRTRTEPGETWRERAGRIVLDPLDAHSEPVATPADRRWLWRIENDLAVSATSDTQRQLAADLRFYLAETCEHHLRHYDGDGEIPEHDQCLWCSEVTFTGDAANKGGARDPRDGEFMTAPSKHDLGQLRHIDLLALAVEAGAAPSDDLLLRLGSRSKDQIIDALTRTGPMVRLTGRAESRLEHESP